ncbi:protocadherin Fat 4-like isoform X1 [Nelusetta ayraudi]|uniref:protocadherin Fat 4-like isoform X1 n=1 Tax=Nelusetta ayraudi TaxID=303726 RepID=UPI003F70693A
MTVTYNISSVLPEKYDRHFSIDASSGVLSVQTSFDREEMSSNNILISIKATQTDDSLKTADAVVLVTVEDVNDSPPVFDQNSYSVTLLENSPNNNTVFKAIVTDTDEGGFVGTLKIIPEATPFTIDAEGTVRVKNSEALDRETNANITFQIEALDTDSAERVVKEVLVILEDENDNSPSFTSNMYYGHVFANQTEGMLLVQVMAEDQDAGENGHVKYNIDFGNSEGYFSIDEDTGKITLAKQIPLQEKKILEFPLYVTASDGGAIPRSSSAQVKILAPGNSIPQFLQKVYLGTIVEEQNDVALVLKISFFALESDTVILMVGTEVDKFSINPNGELFTKKKLDYDEAPHNYSVRISITDGDSTDEAVVEVQVTDINDNSPVFNSTTMGVSVSEDATEGFSVTAVSATDKDSGANGEIRYSLTGGEGRFVVHPESGLVTLAAGLDREVKAEYQLQVLAEDQGLPANTATASLLINVTDVNDNAPVFSQAWYQLQVPENHSIDTSLLTLSATDLDEGENAKVFYKIVHVSPSSALPVFELDSNLGTLQLAQPLLDYSEVKEYTLVVEASDGGTPTLVGNTSVVVKVTDVNNNAPEFDKGSYDVNVTENLVNGAPILTVKVTDNDKGGFNGTLRVLPESAPFSISSDGTITVRNTTALDRETTDTITFQVEATEATPPNQVVTATVHVTLLDENDNSPEFLHSNYEAKLFSNQTEGMLVVRVEAVDADADINGQIKYSIDFGNEQDYFSIDNTGDITLAKLIPVEAHQTKEFSLNVTATDGGVVPRSTSVQVQITAVGVTKPQFLQKIYNGTIEEERDNGTVIVKVGFLAPNVTKVTLQVESEEHKDIFSINQNGDFSTKMKLDYDEAPHNYSVRISITDGDSTDEAVVEVQVTDINDNSPVFNSTSVEVSVSEDATGGFNLTTVSATDRDSGANGEIRYSLTGGEGRFAVHPESGLVTLAAGLDREVKAEYQLQVLAEDQGRPANSANASLLIKVIDVNDNAPEFSQAVYQVLVLEDESTDTILLELSAKDLDEGVNAEVSYKIIDQSPSLDTPVFKLNATSGALQLARPLPDYSEVKEYTLVVEASDGGTPTLVGNTSVVVNVTDVNNNAPEFDKGSYDVNVTENLVNGATILTVKVTDKDEGGFNGTLKVLPESAPFSISSDGTITVRNTTALDRETTDTITFQVEATEATPPNHVVRANVSVTLLDENDNSPEFLQKDYEATIGSSQTERMFVVKVEAEDADADINGQIKYSIDFGNEQDYFSIDNTGNITLAKTIPVEAHQTEEFLLVVTATDGGVVPRSTSVQVQITAVGDTKPQFNQDRYTGTIEEERDNGTVIVKVGFLAPNVTKVTLQVESEEHKDIFSINQNGDFSTKMKLDYDEAPHNYSVRISITDGDSTDEAVVEVQVTDINDNSPVFNSTSVEVSVSEDATGGFNLTTVSATDRDSGANGEIRYSLTGGEGRFAVHPESGLVTLAAGLDREVKAEYQLQVLAEDQGCPANTATASLLINVTDVNDNAPEFPHAQYQVLVPENQSINISLLTLSATDLDDGENAKVSYEIVHVSPSSGLAVFDLDATLGTLKLAKPLLDYSEVKEYTLEVQASDGGTPTLVGNTSVVVKVTDVNNNAPEFDKESYDVDVTENIANGSTILTVKVTDKDEGGFSNGHFNCTSDTFEINNQGVVSLKKDVTLDRETKDNYILQVIAVDQPSGGLSATAVINISILDYNDNAPQFPTIPEQFEVKEGNYSEETPAEIINMKPTDPDLGPNGEVTIAIFPPHPLFRFREDGTLIVVGSLDRESRDTHELVVTASDNGNPQRQSIATVRVRVTDVNDNRPEFSSSSYISSILLKDLRPEKLVLTLEATDKDSGSNSLITYSFLEGGSPYLSLNSTTGVITLTSNVTDVTESTVLKLTAMAQDHGEPPLNATATVTINLRVVAIPEGVAFLSPFYNFSLPENQPAGATLGKVQASSGSDLYSISYSVRNHSDLFSVDTNGALRTKAPLDKELKEWYILEVEAEDTRTPPTSAVTIVTVWVLDVNEPPQFHTNPYQASVFSTAPYKTPVVTVMASDPDVGDSGWLTYSIVGSSRHFDVESSSGLVYVVSVADLAGTKAILEVKVSDPTGLQAVTKVEVVVKGTVDSSDVVVISLNQPASRVEEKISGVESVLSSVLCWTVHILDVRNKGALDSRSLRATTRTLVSFVSLIGEQVVPSEEVIDKLKDHSVALQAALNRLFGEDVDVDVQEPESGGDNGDSGSSSQVVIIILMVLLLLCLLLLIVAVGLLISVHVRQKRCRRQDILDISRLDTSYTNWPQKNPQTIE